MNLFFRVSGVVLILMGFLTLGIVLGAKRGPVTVVEEGRFQKLTDTTALDSKTGQVCDTAYETTDVSLPKGWSVVNPQRSAPLCSELSKN